MVELFSFVIAYRNHIPIFALRSLGSAPIQQYKYVGSLLSFFFTHARLHLHSRFLGVLPDVLIRNLIIPVPRSGQSGGA